MKALGLIAIVALVAGCTHAGPKASTAAAGNLSLEQCEATVLTPEKPSENWTRLVWAGKDAAAWISQLQASYQTCRGLESTDPQITAGALAPRGLKVQAKSCLVPEAKAREIAENQGAQILVWLEPSCAPKHLCPRVQISSSEKLLHGELLRDVIPDGALKLPEIEESRPQALFYTILGLHYLNQSQPRLAIRLFRLALGAVPPTAAGQETLHIALSAAYRLIYDEDYTQVHAKEAEEIAQSSQSPLLAASYRAQALSYPPVRAPDSRKLLEQALSLDEKAYGPNHVAVAQDYRLLGDASHSEQVIEYYQKALSIDKKVFGESHPMVALDLRLLGVSHFESGQIPQGMASIQESILIDEKAFGKDSARLGEDWLIWGMLLIRGGKEQDSLTYFDKAQAILEKATSPKDPSLYSVFRYRAFALWQLGQKEKAQQAMDQALGVLQASWGPNHPALEVRRAELEADKDEAHDEGPLENEP